jgi:hypothetical protein
MLVISRKKTEKIIIADNIEITILELGRSRVRFGIQAPKEIPILTRFKSSPPAAKDEVQPIEAAKPSEPGKALPMAIGMKNNR